ncbi:MAG: ribonuclease Y [Deltaproteobacteria bacterium]|nr:ribonuclease Y [Deltaproteobacteria bacterium]
MNLIETILIVIVGFLVGILFFGVFLHRKKLASSFENAHQESKKILEEARKEADQVVKLALQEAKEESRRRRRTFEEETKKQKGELSKFEKKIREREHAIAAKQETITNRERKVQERETKLEFDEKKQVRLIAETELMIEKSQKTLERVANMSADEARRELMSLVEDEARKEAKHAVRRIEEETQKAAAHRATEIVSLAIQRIASEYVNDATVTVVNLPSEEMKGRIIGREGRNIRAIEQATGVDLIIDDTPEAVIISCFNPIKREIAKITLEKLIADGRIHPARIAETAERIEREFATTIKEYGEQAAFDVGITDLHPDLLSYLGRLRFRTVSTQSVLQHSIETAHICGIIAAELGADAKKAKRAGLLHDIGKAVDQETEGTHSELGHQIAKKYGEADDICEAIRLHHTDNLAQGPALAVILGAANNLSARRPGARKELLSTYIKRLENMEALTRQFKGVEKVHVLQAGREVRALVTPEEASDEDIHSLSHEIASKLRKEIGFPGQVRVTVMKESRYAEYAS